MIKLRAQEPDKTPQNGQSHSSPYLHVHFIELSNILAFIPQNFAWIFTTFNHLFGNKNSHPRLVLWPLLISCQLQLLVQSFLLVPTWQMPGLQGGGTGGAGREGGEGGAEGAGADLDPSGRAGAKEIAKY